MKRVIALLLTLMMILSLAACAAAPAKETNSETTAPAAQENTTETDVPNDVAPGAEYEGKSIQIMFNSDDTWNDVIDNYAKAAIAEAFPGLNVEFVPLQDVPVETLATVGELPDIWFGTVSTAQIEAGICLDLKPYLSDWFTENFNNPNFYNDSKGRVWAVGSGTDTFYTSIKIIPVAQISQTGHSSVNLDMNLQCATAFHGFFAVFKCLCFTGDSLCDVVLNQAADLLLWRMSKNQNRHGNVI